MPRPAVRFTNSLAVARRRWVQSQPSTLTDLERVTTELVPKVVAASLVAAWTQAAIDWRGASVSTDAIVEEPPEIRPRYGGVFTPTAALSDDMEESLSGPRYGGIFTPKTATA